MEACDELERATALLRTAVRDFAIGAVTLSDYKPTEEKIRDIREKLKCVNARIQLLRATNGTNSVANVSPEDPKELEKQLQRTISCNVHSYKALKNTVQSLAAENMKLNNEINPQISRKLQAIMNKLYMQNDKIIELEEEIGDLYVEERDLQTNLVASVIKFQSFLKEQEKVRNQKLAESNPEIAKKKKKLKKMIEKINLSKKIITNVISASSVYVIDRPELLKMLKDHRDLVNEEAISELTRN